MPKTQKDNEYSFDHSVQRFKERYNRELVLKNYQNWCKNAKDAISGKTIDDMTILSKQKVNNTNTSYVIHYKLLIDAHDKLPTDMYFVYETERDTITTFLPPDSIKPEKMTKFTKPKK